MMKFELAIALTLSILFPMRAFEESHIDYTHKGNEYSVIHYDEDKINPDEDMRLFLSRIDRFEPFIRRCAESYSVPENLVKSVIFYESSGLSNSSSNNSSAKGLMQLLDNTTHEISQELGFGWDFDILDPKTNVLFGTYYLSKMVARYGDYRTAILAYAIGQGGVDSFNEDELLSSSYSNRYVNNVMKMYYRLNSISG